MNQIRIKSAQVRALLWLAIAVCPWFFALHYGLTFDINDDVANIVLFREIYGSGSADSSIFVSSLFTHGLIALYRFNAEIPWYPLLVYLSLGAAQLLFLQLIGQSRVSPLFRLFLLLGTSTVVFKLALSSSFTASALMLSGAALLYGFLRPFSRRTPHRIIAILFLSIGFLLRPGIFPVAILAFLPVVAAAVLSRAYSIRYVAGFFLLLFFVIGSLYSVDLSMESEAKKTFKQTNALRAQFSDSLWGQTSKNFAMASFAAGWSLDDYVVVKNLWWYGDVFVHSSDSFREFVQANQAEKPVPWTMSILTSNLSRVKHVAALYLALMVVWLVWEHKYSRHWLWPTVLLGVGCVVLMSGIRFPARIAYPFFLLLLLSPLAGISSKESRQYAFGLFQRGALLSILVLLFWNLSNDVQVHKVKQMNNFALSLPLNSALQKLSSQANEALFVPLPWRGRSELSFVEPFKWQRLHNALPSGWMARSPLMPPYLETMGLAPNRNLVSQLLDRNEVFWYFLIPKSEVRNYVSIFLRYLNNHYGDSSGSTRLIPLIRNVKDVGKYSWVFFQVEEQYLLKQGQ